MSNTYFKFKLSKAETRITPEAIGRNLPLEPNPDVVPLGNPDFDEKIKLVVEWLIEFENDSYFPNREIGLDVSDLPIIIMPWGRNYGYWTDNNLVIGDFRKNFATVNIERAEFENYWKSFKPSM